LRINLRIILSIVVVISILALLFTFMQVQQEKKRLMIDLQRRASLLGESLVESIEPLLERGPPARLQKIVEKFGNRERLAGIAVYDVKDKLIAATPPLASHLSAAPAFVMHAMNSDIESGEFFQLDEKEMYLYALPLHREENVAGALVIIHDPSYIQERLSLIWKDNLIRFLVYALVISLATLLLIRWSMAGPIGKMAEWMKHLRTKRGMGSLYLPSARIFEPLTREVTQMARSISAARKAAEEEARLRNLAESTWTPTRLKEQVCSLLQERPLFVISNREPYMHEKRGKQIECLVPASGLVTALEPVLKACGGTWIAHGSGDADREVVDAQSKINVPPEEPQYVLKRVWLTEEEEKGYYYGFSNEGFWPLCHVAHTRPSFQVEDWEYYQIVNRKFAETTLEELKGAEEPLILIQDYHFALLPRLIKEERPDARLALFWHIPWPNPEFFSICPWQKEILHGMLGADLIGFHTQFHCNNFLDTVDRTLESRIDWEHFAIERGGQSTLVKPFPISIAFPDKSNFLASSNIKRPDKESLLMELGVKAKYFGVGVDRIDYTKGILERFKAIERFLEKYPAYQGEFTFIELGAPSRTHIKEYHDLITAVEMEVDRINWRFKTKEWQPIVFLKKQHSHEEIRPFYETADLCMVTSLHDGMNLVAKEYVGVRDDESGVLILSQFTGAARELSRDALIVNPYDVEEMVEAIRTALEMSVAEQKARMHAMRETLKSRNIYYWAANLITALAQVRLEKNFLKTLPDPNPVPPREEIYN